MAGIHHEKLRAHFQSKGLEVYGVKDVHGWLHTLSVYDRRGGKSYVDSHLFSFRVSKRDGLVDQDHLREQVSRYSRGLPSIHPHTGRED